MSDLPNTSTPSKEREIEISLARSDVYAFLSRAFLYPEESFFLAGQRARDSLVNLGREELSAPLGILQSTSQEELQAQYRRVFGHTSPKDFPPYETEYGNAHLFQQAQALSDVAGFYKAFGVQPARKERLDHIAVELEFMYFLTFKEAYAREYHRRQKALLCREGQQRFFQNHLGRWAPLFLGLLETRAPEGFYGELATVTRAFLTAEGKLLKVAPLPLPETHFIGFNIEDQCFSCPLGGTSESPL